MPEKTQLRAVLPPLDSGANGKAIWLFRYHHTVRVTLSGLQNASILIISTVAHTRKPSLCRNAETGGFTVQGQPGFHSGTLSQNPNQTKPNSDDPNQLLATSLTACLLLFGVSNDLWSAPCFTVFSLPRHSELGASPRPVTRARSESA